MTKASLIGQDKKVIYTRRFDGDLDKFVNKYHSVLDDLLQFSYTPAAHEPHNDLSVRISGAREIKAFSEETTAKDDKPRGMKTTIVTEENIKVTPVVPYCFYCDAKKCSECLDPMISMAKTAFLKSTIFIKSK